MWIDAFRKEHRLSRIRLLVVMDFRADTARLIAAVRGVVVLEVPADKLKESGLDIDLGQHGSVIAD